MKSSYTDSLAHTTYECKYHIVFAPKFRRKEIYGTLRREIGIDIIEKIADFYVNKFHIGESYDLAYWTICAVIIIIAVSLSNFLHYGFAVHDVKYKDTSNMAG